MRKLSKARIDELAHEALSKGNPYIDRSVPFNVDMETKYIYRDGKVYTKEELDEAYLEHARKEIAYGYDERGVGYYDKWHRYNEFDNGRAYDLGVQEASNTPGCPPDIQFIEVIEATGPEPYWHKTRAQQNAEKNPYTLDEER